MIVKLSPTESLVQHPVFGRLLGGAVSKADRAAIVNTAREHATLILSAAVARIPVENPRIIAAYKAQGKNLVWMLADNEDAIRFCQALHLHDHTPAEQDAADLLRACVAAAELGDVPEFRDMRAGENRSHQSRQAAKMPRPNRRNPLRSKIMAVIGRERRDGRRLKDILDDWDIIDGLRLTWANDEWIVSDEDSIDTVQDSYSQRQMQKIFTAVK